MSLEQKIKCPHCEEAFELAHVVTHQMQEVIASEVKAKLQKKESLLEQSYKRKEVEAEAALKALSEKAAMLEKAAAEEKRRSEKMIADARDAALKEAAKEKEELRLQLIAEATKKAQDQYALQTSDLKNQLEELALQKKEAIERELALMTEKRKAEEAAHNAKLEAQRQLSAERELMETELRRRADEEHALKLQEKEKQIADMKKLLEEAQRKSAQGSQQLQGEVFELKLEEQLRAMFPDDEIEEVKKGARGADVSLNVRLSSGRSAGTIFFECKDVKEWNAQWIPKLKQDMRDAGADLGVIVSTVLPKEVKNMACVDGIWVCSHSLFGVLSTLLREQLIKVTRATLAAETPKDQKDLLFSYMTSNRFVQKIQGICEKMVSMKETLESEKRATQKNWKKREIEIEVMSSFMSGLYGELDGVVGKSLPRIDLLELSAPETDEPT